MAKNAFILLLGLTLLVAAISARDLEDSEQALKVTKSRALLETGDDVDAVDDGEGKDDGDVADAADDGVGDGQRKRRALLDGGDDDGFFFGGNRWGFGGGNQWGNPWGNPWGFGGGNPWAFGGGFRGRGGWFGGDDDGFRGGFGDDRRRALLQDNHVKGESLGKRLLGRRLSQFMFGPPQGRFVPGGQVPGQFVPGQQVPGGFVPGGQFPGGQFGPNQFPGGQFRGGPQFVGAQPFGFFPNQGPVRGRVGFRGGDDDGFAFGGDDDGFEFGGDDDGGRGFGFGGGDD